MAITVSVAGSNVSIFVDSIQISDKEAQRSTAQFTVRDDAGTAAYMQNMAVTITDSVLGLQFAGYIDSAAPRLLNPQPNKMWDIICKDKTYLASKRQCLQADFTGTLAGDVVTDLHAKYLAAEGVTANYATRHDNSAATFGAGTLTNLTATSGVLELSLAGSTATTTETTTANFTTGTLTNVSASNNTLILSSTSAIKIVGTAAASVGNNLYYYAQISTGGGITLNTGDQLIYDVFVSSTSPAISCGLDLIFTDGSNLRDRNFRDQYGFISHAGANLAGYANDMWMHRVIQLSTNNEDLAGLTIGQVTIGLEGDAGGTYTAYVRSATIKTSGGTTRTTIFSSSLSQNFVISTLGYYSTSVSVVTAYNHTGNRVSSAYSISGAGIAKSSLISWTSPAYTQPSSGQSSIAVSPLIIETSIDGGATYQVCTNHMAIPDLLAGMNLTSRTITLRETLNLGGPNPEITPVLNDVTFSISPSYAVTKTDAFDFDANSTDFGTGTRTNVQYTTGIGEQITGSYKGWQDGSLASQTQYGDSGGNPDTSIENGQLELRCGSSSPPDEMRSQFNFAGQWQNFICEVDITHYTDTTSNINNGIVYRTTGWQNNNDTYAYCVQMESTSIALVRGTNSSSGAGSSTLIQRTTVGWVAGAAYHVQIIVSGSSHQVYVNNIRYINSTDSTFSGSGYLGARLYNNTSTRISAFFDNFGVMSSAFTASRVHSSLSLTALSTVENSLIHWNATTPGNTALLIESSINGGSSYQTCTNNAVIPNLTPGTNVSGVSLLIRETLTTQNANSSPILTGIGVFVIGNYSATGTRVSPSLAIGAVGRVGSSSITWTADVPSGTTLLTEESLIGATGAWTTATSGAAIPTITSQPASVSDTFAVSSSGNFTSTNYAAGVNATWTFDTSNSRLVGTNGTNGLYVWNQLSAKDMQIEAILNQAGSAGLTWRYTDANNFYFVVIADASAGSNPNTVKIYKRVASVTSAVLATGTISFVRGQYHNLRITMIGTAIIVYFDGVSVASVTDSGLSSVGSAGFLQSSAIATNWYSVRGQQFGDDVTGKSVWTKQTLTSTDPTLTPGVSDLVTSVRGQQLMSGSVVGVTAYQYTSSVLAALDDLAKKSPNYTDGITDTGVLTFQSHQAVPADWPLATVNGDIQWSTQPTLKKYSPLYRNRHVVVGGMDATAIIPDTRTGDSFTQTWILAYPVDSVSSISLNGQPATYGVQGVDTGMDFYYQVGSKTITQDTTLTPPSDTDTFTFNYYGQQPVVKTSESLTQQTALAALEGGGSSGIVEVVETVAGLDAVAAQNLADSRVAQYAILSQDWNFTTLRAGLKSGQLLSIFCPEYSLNDLLVLVTDVNTIIKQGSSDASTLVFYTVQCTSGPNVGDWSKVFVDQ